jgi:hypothetical protein
MFLLTEQSRYRNITMDLAKIDFKLYNKYDKNKNSYNMNVDTLSLLATNNLLMFCLAEGGCVTGDWKNNIIIIIIALLL